MGRVEGRASRNLNVTGRGTRPLMPDTDMYMDMGWDTNTNTDIDTNTDLDTDTNTDTDTDAEQVLAACAHARRIIGVVLRRVGTCDMCATAAPMAKNVANVLTRAGRVCASMGLWVWSRCGPSRHYNVRLLMVP
eukprot:29124-Chlamydomonas_euryale.AAC.2